MDDEKLLHYELIISKEIYKFFEKNKLKTEEGILIIISILTKILSLAKVQDSNFDVYKWIESIKYTCEKMYPEAERISKFLKEHNIKENEI